VRFTRLETRDDRRLFVMLALLGVALGWTAVRHLMW